MGYWRAGFDVFGVDINPQPNYPFEFFQHDAIDFLGYGLGTPALEEFDAIHASPPCQFASSATRTAGTQHLHPNLIPETRSLLQLSGVPYVIENVEGAREYLISPVTLEGSMFGLRTYRPRLFETSFPLIAPPRPPRSHKTTKMGRPPRSYEFMHIVGHFSGANEGRWAMGIDWMTKAELAEAIPPAYSAYVGCFLHQHLGTAVAA